MFFTQNFHEEWWSKWALGPVRNSHAFKWIVCFGAGTITFTAEPSWLGERCVRPNVLVGEASPRHPSSPWRSPCKEGWLSRYLPASFRSFAVNLAVLLLLFFVSSFLSFWTNMSSFTCCTTVLWIFEPVSPNRPITWLYYFPSVLSFSDPFSILDPYSCHFSHLPNTSGLSTRDWHGYGYPWISADIHLTRGYGWIWMKPPNTRMDMDGWSSSRFGYGWIWICLPLWIGLDWMDIPTFEYIRVYQSTTTKRKVLKMLSSFNVFRWIEIYLLRSAI